MVTTGIGNSLLMRTNRLIRKRESKIVLGPVGSKQWRERLYIRSPENKLKLAAYIYMYTLLPVLVGRESSIQACFTHHDALYDINILYDMKSLVGICYS